MFVGNGSISEVQISSYVHRCSWAPVIGTNCKTRIPRMRSATRPA